MLQLIKFVITSLITLLIASGALFLVVNFVEWHGGNIVGCVILLAAITILVALAVCIVTYESYHNYKMFKLYGKDALV